MHYGFKIDWPTCVKLIHSIIYNRVKIADVINLIAFVITKQNY